VDIEDAHGPVLASQVLGFRIGLDLDSYVFGLALA